MKSDGGRYRVVDGQVNNAAYLAPRAHSQNLAAVGLSDVKIATYGDHGVGRTIIYSAIRRLRDALCDSVESPRYVETLARRGYRFMAPVKEDTAPTETPSADSPASANRGSGYIGKRVVGSYLSRSKTAVALNASGLAYQLPVTDLAEITHLEIVAWACTCQPD